MPADQNQPTSRAQFAARLREESLAVRLDRSQFGSSRKLTNEQRDRAAQLFGAESTRLSAGKKLLNKRHEAYLQVTALLGRARELWITSTLPYPEPGLRLIRRSDVTRFDEQMRVIKAQLQAAVATLQDHYPELLAQAQEQLGELYNASDYPMTLGGEFDISWGFSNVDPPEYLRQISPKLYEQEQERTRARFAEAVALAEQAFVEEFSKAVSHLVERLTPSPDGKAKIIKESLVGNLDEFLARFKALNIGSNPDLDALVEQAANAVKGINADALRKDVTARDTVRDAMAQLTGKLDGMMVDKPKRKIKLDDRSANGDSAGGQQEAGSEAA